MSEQKVLCPWCGGEMEPTTRFDEQGFNYDGAYSCVRCYSKSPISFSKSSKAEAIESAYLAATRRQPNLPITREQIADMPDDDALWLVEKYDGTIHVQSVFETDISDGYQTLDLFYIFAAKPTPADIEAARKATAP